MAEGGAVKELLIFPCLGQENLVMEMNYFGSKMELMWEKLKRQWDPHKNYG